MASLPPDCRELAIGASPSTFERLLRAFSILTMVMTIPQVVSVWTATDATGISLISWATYLASACLWFVYGIRRGDKTIYLACIGWILLDASIVVGVMVRG